MSPRRAMRPLALAVAGLACALALAACGSKQDVTAAPSAKPFSVMLDWFPNADHAALYAAIAGGDFRAAGLDVQPVVPAESAEPLKLLAAGKVDAAISYEPELLLARDAGLRLVSIGALVQRPLTSIIALPGHHVSSVADLAGKRVGTAGISYQAAELRSALAAAGVKPGSVQEVNVGFDLVPAMLSGKVDATLGGFWNYEAIQLRLLHKDPLVIPINQAGVPSYDELVLVVREDRGAHARTGSAGVPAGAYPGRATGRRQSRRRRGAADQGQPLAAAKASAGIDPEHAARGAARRTRTTPSAGRNRRPGRRSGAGCSPMGCSRTTPTPPASRSPTSSSPGRASDARRDRGVRIGVLTGGGDCPGLNAVIRAVVRRGLAEGATASSAFATAGPACSRRRASS